MITISVVIPCYNRERTIGEAVTSAVTQTRRPLEIIVADDASTDNSVAVAKDAGARVVRLSANRGSAVARNAGIQAARGDAIAWLDSDDFWEPHHLETVGSLLDMYPDAAVASAAVRRVGSASGNWYCSIPDGPPTNVLRTAFYDWLMPSITTIVRRDAMIAAGSFDESERFAVDFDAWLRLARRYKFVASREVTANWRWHDSQLSGSLPLQLEATYRSRSRMLKEVQDAGEMELAEELARSFRWRWRTHAQEAWDDGRIQWLRRLVQLAPLVPGVPGALLRKWRLKSKTPEVLIRGVRAYRAHRRALPDINAAQ